MSGRPPETLDSLELALAAARREAALEAPARAVLDANARLLQEQVGLARNERFRNRIKAVRDASVSAGAVLLLLAAASMLWSAWRANEIVLQAFSVPPSMAADGFTGEALAGELLDRIGAIQAVGEIYTTAAGADARDEGESLRVEIPETGVTIGEAEQYLRRRLGRQTVVSGSLRRRGDRLFLSVRASGSPGRTLQADEDELPALVQTAAEAILRDTQPLRLAAYLSAAKRPAEAEDVLRPLLGRGSDQERATAYAALSAVMRDQGRRTEALRATRQAVRLDPSDVTSLAYLGFAEDQVGHSEAALSAWQSAISAFRRSGGAAGLSPSARQILEPQIGGFVARARQNHAVSATRFGEFADVAGRHSTPDMQAYGLLEAARSAAAARDLPAARHWLSGFSVTQTPEDRLVLQLASAVAVDDWPRALAASLALPDAGQELVAHNVQLLARSGRLQEAADRAKSMPGDCYPCLIARGELAARRNDPVAADRAFAEAVRQGPSLSAAHNAWGEAKLARGDPRGAIGAFQEAQRRAPRWADPLKLEGDALQRQGEQRAALRRYNRALELAPSWGAAHLAAGRSLEAVRDRAKAAVAYRRALTLDLNAVDRAEARGRLEALT